MSISTKSSIQEEVAKISASFSRFSDYKVRISSFFIQIPKILTVVQASLQQKFRRESDNEGSIKLGDQKNQANTLQNLLFENHDFLPLSKSLTYWISVLGRSPIPEELLKLFFESSCSDQSLKHFKDALDQLIDNAILQFHSSSTPDFKCYQIDFHLQEVFYCQLSSELQNDICAMVLQATQAKLNELIQDKKRHKKGFHFYLDHIIFFSRKEPFKLLLNCPQKSEILLILDRLFEEEGFYEKTISQPIQDMKSHGSINKDFYAHIQIVLNDLCNAYASLKEYSKVIQCYEKELEIAQLLMDSELEMKIYGNLGNVYSSLRKYDQAIEYHEEFLKIALEIKNALGIGRAYANLGNTYYLLRKYDQAIEYHERDLNIALETKNLLGEERAYNNLGNAYNALRKYDLAIEYHEKSLKIALELGDQVGQWRAYCNIGNTYLSLGKLFKTIECIENGLKIILILGNREEEGRAYARLGNIYETLKESHKAI
ncbi:tetratricopeptide repeat protein [Rhabdochlamydiaceae symbiont of Dictyostelium giganteum]|uniref:tetratricopeptide repeat protein n=1 Tax=Rhabdochlamydiaceae symbiont of Dictyostelium giganteum TaxID=3342349 RepID=UPI00384EA1B3